MTRIVATYQDYVALPDDGRRWEIHEGELVPAPPVGTRHQTVAAELLHQLARHVEDRRLGEVFPGPLDVILSDTTVLQPDIVFLATERSHLVSERAIEGAPTLVVEILTPASTLIDRVTKPILYARHGVPFVWLVDPEGESLEAFALAGGRYRLAVRASGAVPASLPPFDGLVLEPRRMWRIRWVYPIRGIDRQTEGAAESSPGWGDMHRSSVVLTYDDYVALPADGRRYELHGGALSVTPAPGVTHERVKRRLFARLLHHVEARRLGEVFDAPVDVLLSDTTVLQPDILFVATDRAALVAERGVVGPPTLVIEVVSPSSRTVDHIVKRQLYARHGVPYYWTVDPAARSIEALVLGPEGYEVAVRATGVDPVSPPPFSDLALVPDALWPAP